MTLSYSLKIDKSAKMYNIKFDENGRELKKPGEKENALVRNNFSSHSVFERLILQTHKDSGLFWNWVILWFGRGK